MNGGIKKALVLLIVVFGVGNQLTAFDFSQEGEPSLVGKELVYTSISSPSYVKLSNNNTTRKKTENFKSEIIVGDSVLGGIFKKNKIAKLEPTAPLWEEYAFNLRKDISKYSRIELGNSVSTNSYAINDQFRPNTIANMVSFNLYDNKLNVHSFSGIQSTMYPLNFTTENTVNTKLDLLGFEYRFKRNKTKKFRYSGRARLEQDDEQRTYYQFGLGVNWKNLKRSHSLSTEHFPVRSGPGHILKIYRTQLAMYNEFQLGAHFKQIALIEGNYYSDQKIDAILVTRTEYGITATNTFKVSPLVEIGYGEGTINQRDSYPYWMARRRAYGGAGVAFTLGSENSKFRMIADASMFGEISQKSFERYTGNLSYNIKNFTSIHAGFEVYTVENFYSNVAQLGMIYQFK